jgi:hypothetical protein
MSSVFKLRNKIDNVFEEPPRITIIGSPQPTSQSLLSSITNFFGPSMTNGPSITYNPTNTPEYTNNEYTNNIFPTITPDITTTLRITTPRITISPENMMNDDSQYEQMTNITTEPRTDQSYNENLSDKYNELSYCSKNNTSNCKMETILQKQPDDINLFDVNRHRSPSCPTQNSSSDKPEDEDILEYYKKNQVIVKSYLDDDLMLGANINDYENISSLDDHGALRPEIKEFQYPKPNGYIFNNSSVKI